MSVEGRPVECVEIGPSDAPRASVAMPSIHALERIGAHVLHAVR
jgi:hypothetical protein